MARRRGEGTVIGSGPFLCGHSKKPNWPAFSKALVPPWKGNKGKKKDSQLRELLLYPSNVGKGKHVPEMDAVEDHGCSTLDRLDPQWVIPHPVPDAPSFLNFTQRFPELLVEPLKALGPF